MPNTQKLKKLLSHNYHANIVIEETEGRPKVIIIADSNSGTMFWAVENAMFSFKDEDDNMWSTVPDSLIINDEKHHPQIGHSITGPDGETCIFSTEETILGMATHYFEKHIDIFYGFDLSWNVHTFGERIKGKIYTYELLERGFKSALYEKIDWYISSN